MKGKLEPNFRALRMYEGFTQEEVGDKVGIQRGVVLSQEHNLDKTSFGRVKELFEAIGYRVYVEKVEKD